MHADLVAISNLWQLDQANDRLRAEHDGLTGAVRAADTAHKAAEVALEEAESRLSALQQRTRKNDRELADYAEKRDKTRAMIDGGVAPDYDAATRQLAQCLEIVDRLETTALELMEGSEAAAKAEVAAEKACEAATALLASTRESLAARDAGIRLELTGIIAAREPVAVLVPTELRAQYAQQRQKKKSALVNTQENICQSCQTKVPAQRVLETALARAIHTCPGCGGWLLP